MSALDDAVANVVYDLSQLDQKSWFAVVRRSLMEAQEIGKREARAELATLQAHVAELEAANAALVQEIENLIKIMQGRYALRR